jgi:hypothetical protein
MIFIFLCAFYKENVIIEKRSLLNFLTTVVNFLYYAIFLSII